MERSYDQAQDMWSFGCIIYELLKYITRENKAGQAEFKRHRYLFKGSSCFPLSPLKNETGQSTSIVALEDQMHIILKSLGR
jgi:serine/threonine protein kinase